MKWILDSDEEDIQAIYFSKFVHTFVNEFWQQIKNEICPKIPWKTTFSQSSLKVKRATFLAAIGT